MLNLISFIIVISISVISHEFGHFITAKHFCVFVHEFSFGMGPSLISVKHGNTLYSFRLLPIGGYVKFEGEDGSTANSVNKGKSLNNVCPMHRLFIVLAGPVVNILLALIFTTAFLYSNGIYDSTTTYIGKVLDGSPAAISNFQPDDRILSINNIQVKKWNEISSALNIDTHRNNVFNIKLDRSGALLEKEITILPDKGRYFLGILPRKLNLTFFSSLKNAFNYLESMTISILRGFTDLVIGNSTGEVVGPVGIAVIAGDSIRQGFWSFITFLAIINLHLGLINLFPFPALDGGRAFLIAFELITGKKMSENKEIVLHYIGFLVLISLMLVVTLKDLIKIISG